MNNNCDKDLIIVSSDDNDEEPSSDSVLCQRLSDNKCWFLKSDTRTGDVGFQPVKHYHPVWPQSLPDLEEDTPVGVKCAKIEPPEDCQYVKVQQVMPLPLAVSVPCRRHRLISRRYVSSPDLPASHAALKPFYGSEILHDNSSAVQIGVFSHWKNIIIEPLCSTQHLTLPSVLRQMASNDCGVSDQALEQCICSLLTYKNTRQLYSLYSAMKALSAFHPRSSHAVNCHQLDRLSDKRRDETESIRVHLVYDYIVSCVELELLHYPVVRHRGQEISKLLAVDGSLVRTLVQETKNQHNDMKTVVLLQRAVTAVGVSDNWLLIDRLVSRLYHLYRDIHCVHDRQRLLASVAKPELRLKLVERILGDRCGGQDIPRLSRQFLTRGFVTALSSLLPEWLHLQPSSSSADLIEEFLAVIVTYVESNFHVHKDIARHRVGSVSILHDELACSLQQVQAGTHSSGMLKASVNAHLHQLCCLEDVFLAA